MVYLLLKSDKMHENVFERALHCIDSIMFPCMLFYQQLFGWCLRLIVFSTPLPIRWHLAKILTIQYLLIETFGTKAQKTGNSISWSGLLYYTRTCLKREVFSRHLKRGSPIQNIRVRGKSIIKTLTFHTTRKLTQNMIINPGKSCHWQSISLRILTWLNHE